jgi:hypothetical protein
MLKDSGIYAKCLVCFAFIYPLAYQIVKRHRIMAIRQVYVQDAGSWIGVNTDAFKLSCYTVCRSIFKRLFPTFTEAAQVIVIAAYL